MSALEDSRADRERTAPFHLKVFYRAGSHHRPDEFSGNHFSSSSSLPSPYFTISTWPSCTLRELSHILVHELARPPPPSSPSSPDHPPSFHDDPKYSQRRHHDGDDDGNPLPSPAVGTRLVFRLIYPDPAALRSGGSGNTARYTSKDLGSVVIGGDGTGRLSDPEADEMDVEEEGDGALPATQAAAALGGEPDRTLADARFVIGDFLSVAILPPGRNGEVVGASAAKGPPPLPPTALPGAGGGGSGGGMMGRGRRRYGDEEGGANGWHAGRRQPSGSGYNGAGGGQLPRGDWRRGERLPPVDPRGYGRGRR